MRGGVGRVLSLTGGLCVAWAAAASPADDAALERALDAAHGNLVRRFLGADGLLRGWEGPDPAPKDCAEGRPSYIGWATPVENAPMFTGMWLPAVCARATRSGKPEDRELARRLAAGLMKVASVSDVPGFIARGTATDGKAHYPYGSSDQTCPWYLGLYFYLKSGLPTPEEARAIVAKVREVTEAIAARDWNLPCDGVFAENENCGTLRKPGLLYRDTAHYLFCVRAAHEITRDEKWLRFYYDELMSAPKGCCMTRLEVMEEGYVVDLRDIRVEPGLLWIYTHQQIMQAELTRLETRPRTKARLRKGLLANARRTGGFLGAAANAPRELEKPYSAADWTKFVTWSPQKTHADAKKVAGTITAEGLRRKHLERNTVTAPLCAAIVATYARDPATRAETVRMIGAFDYAALNLCEFFLAETWRFVDLTADDCLR